MILAATRDAARLFLELGTVTVVLAVGARLAARTGFSSIPLYLVVGIVLGALAPPTLGEVLVTTLSEVGRRATLSISHFAVSGPSAQVRARAAARSCLRPTPYLRRRGS